MNTPDPKLLQVEAVADLPVLWNVLQRLDLVTTLDRLDPAPARWQGAITPGELLAVGLLHLLSRGDHRSKMGAFITRQTIEKTHDFYLCPLSEVQLSVAQRLQRLATHRTAGTPLLPVHRVGKKPAEPE
jgi:hypothetical protein